MGVFMKSQDEIINRINNLQNDFLGFKSEVLIEALDFDHAKQYFKPDVTRDKWPDESSEDVQKEKAYKYLDFAFGKALDHRGISASRSVEKLAEWAWIFDQDIVSQEMNNAPHAMYGVPALFIFAKTFNQLIPDDSELLRMSKGSPCKDDCCEGC